MISKKLVCLFNKLCAFYVNINYGGNETVRLLTVPCRLSIQKNNMGIDTCTHTHARTHT